MKPAIAALLVLLSSVPGAFQTRTSESADTATIAKIRDEGLTRSQVMDTIFWLTDRYGPRLTGSPEFEEAGDWVVKRLESWGLSNVHKERFASGRGWSLLNFHAAMTSPRTMPIIGMPKAWTPATNGTIVADVVRPVITTAVDAARWRGKLRGKIVLTQSARVVRMYEHGDGDVLRYADQGGKWRDEAMTPHALPADEDEDADTSVPDGAFNLLRFYQSEGVAALFDRGPSGDLASGGSDLSWVQQRPDGGTLFVQNGASPYADPAATLPQVTLAVEHYNRMVRLLEHDVPVTVELNIQARFTGETAAHPNSFNVIGEIPGTDKAGEVVLLGAHLDSWHGGTGATDNAAGVAATMDAVRIIRTLGLRPRRTIRIGLWGDEETGLHGSAAYVRAHLGTAGAPAPGAATLSVYFNLDNGTGPIRGVWTEGNAAVQEIFEAWSAPLADLGVTMISPRGVPSTDHLSFRRVGIPSFQFVQERYEYNSRTHHSTMDVYDRVQPDDVKQAATVAAAFAWQAAQRDDLLPRMPVARSGR
ncbi:MAG TPA: M20/M25/M40 family metallo-hydrolase [Vicinamibacterales bacterium]|nr:M20/M25/M40 family metallo-hydrolase [Vicinamibacterales bacterium]